MTAERFGVLRKYLTRGTEAWNLQVQCLPGVLSKSKVRMDNLIKPYLKMNSKKGGSDIYIVVGSTMPQALGSIPKITYI